MSAGAGVGLELKRLEEKLGAATRIEELAETIAWAWRRASEEARALAAPRLRRALCLLKAEKLEEALGGLEEACAELIRAALVSLPASPREGYCPGSRELEGLQKLLDTAPTITSIALETSKDPLATLSELAASREALVEAEAWLEEVAEHLSARGAADPHGRVKAAVAKLAKAMPSDGLRGILEAVEMLWSTVKKVEELWEKGSELLEAVEGCSSPLCRVLDVAARRVEVLAKSILDAIEEGKLSLRGLEEASEEAAAAKKLLAGLTRAVERAAFETAIHGSEPPPKTLAEAVQRASELLGRAEAELIARIASEGGEVDGARILDADESPQALARLCKMRILSCKIRLA